MLTGDVKMAGGAEENASNSESEPCMDMTDDQLRGGGVIRRLSDDDVRDRDDWRIMDDVEDADQCWNAAAAAVGTEGNDTGVIMGRRRDSAAEMFGSDDGDRLHDDSDNEDNADDDSNSPGDDPEVPVAMATGPAAAARWLFPATAMAAPPLGTRMLAGAAAPQTSAIGRDSNVKLAAMENTDVAVAQFAENNILPADIAALNVVLWNLHQQQMFQMHMILQLQQQIIYASAASGAAGGVVGGLPAAAAACPDPQRDATLPDVLQNNKPDDSSAVLDPVPGSSAAAGGFRDSLYKPLVPSDAAAPTALEKSTDIASSATVADGVTGSRTEVRSPVSYVSAPSVTTIPPMLAMMDMSLGRLEPPAKEGTVIFTSLYT